MPSSPETSRRPRAPGLDSKVEIGPRETRQRCGESSSLSSAQAQDPLPCHLPSPESSCSARPLEAVGPRGGVVEGARFSRAGECSTGGLRARRTMAVSESERSSARVLFVFWRGVVTRLGRNLGGRAQSSRKGVGGAAGTGHRLSTERISPQSETLLWTPGRPPHRAACAVPLHRLLSAACGSGVPARRFDFWRVWIAWLSPSAAGRAPASRAPPWRARGGRAGREKARPHLEV